jgi:hypothetical protein
MTQFPAEPSPGGVIWTVQFSDTDHRQLTTAEVIRAFENRQLSPYSMVCKEGQPWTQIGNVPHLVHAISTVVKRRNSTPPPPPVGQPVPVASSPPVMSPPAAPLSAPLNVPFVTPPLDSQVAVPLITRNEPAMHLVDAGDRDIATTPGVNRNTSTVTPFTVVSPPQEDDFAPPPRGSTARWALIGAAAAIVLFGVAFGTGLFKTVSTAAVTPLNGEPPKPLAASQPETQPVQAPPAEAAAQPTTPGAVIAAGGTAAAPVILDFDSLPVDGNRSAARAAPSEVAPITLEAARKAMLEPVADTPPASDQPPGSSLDGPLKNAPIAAAASAATDPAKPPGAFDNAAARSALAAASQRAQGCLGMGLVHASGKVVVVFDPSGGVSAVNILSPEFAKPPLGPCLVTAFKQASVPPFVGAPTAVSKTFTQ